MYIPVDKSLKFFLGDRFGGKRDGFLLEKCRVLLDRRGFIHYNQYAIFREAGINSLVKK